MLIRNIDETPKKKVEMEGVVGASMAVMVGRDDGAPTFALRQFEVEPAGHTPRHSHDFEHEVYIVSGSGEVLLEGEFRPIRGGDVIYVPKNHEHQFRAGGDQPLRFLCMVPMERDCGEPVPGS
ncbi:MAG: cupin domain-containing protein [Phycisphaeraceae bacterium]|nr:MAG: cupin domain-containing protein [Phycisphaeraceae bacterium]